MPLRKRKEAKEKASLSQTPSGRDKFYIPVSTPQETAGPDDDEGEGIFIEKREKIHNLATRTLAHTHRVDTRFVL